MSLLFNVLFLRLLASDRDIRIIRTEAFALAFPRILPLNVIRFLKFPLLRFARNLFQQQGQHTLRKVKFLSRNSILTKPEHFHEFLTRIFLTIFLVKSKLSTAKKSKSKTAAFSRVFAQNNFYSAANQVIWTKN